MSTSSPTEKQVHYTARLVVTKVDKTPGDRNMATRDVSVERTTHEIAAFNLRSTDLTALKQKLGAHVELIEED